MPVGRGAGVCKVRRYDVQSRQGTRAAATPALPLLVPPGPCRSSLWWMSRPLVNKPAGWLDGCLPACLPHLELRDCELAECASCMHLLHLACDCRGGGTADGGTLRLVPPWRKSRNLRGHKRRACTEWVGGTAQAGAMRSCRQPHPRYLPAATSMSAALVRGLAGALGGAAPTAAAPAAPATPRPSPSTAEDASLARTLLAVSGGAMPAAAEVDGAWAPAGVGRCVCGGGGACVYLSATQQQSV